MRKLFAFLSAFIISVASASVVFADDTDFEAARAAAITIRGNAGAATASNQSQAPGRITTGRGAPVSVAPAAISASDRTPQTATRANSLQTSRTAVSSREVQARDNQTVTSSGSRALSSRTAALSRIAVPASNTGQTSGPGRTNITSARTASNVIATAGARPSIGAGTARSATQTSRAATNVPGRISRAGQSRAMGAGISRAATNQSAVMGATGAVESADAPNYTTCRETFYQCMDEFCATKDTQLKRCACSSRVHEFDAIQKQLEEIESKMQDFNEQLLVVGMDKEDATAMISETEGEAAFQLSDTSDSKGILDTIMDKLKSNSTDSNNARDLSAMTLSMNTGSAFDTIDFEMGADTTTKEGEALYNAALPICEDIIAEVCDEDSLSMVKSAYNMAIQQDCNAVAGAYAARQDIAREKIREGGALLDMSRLDDYQTRNADDILTCKKKMMDMMADNSVCGADYSKCLDWSGKYIDPGTGQAILTENLSDLANTITKPTGDEKWATMPANEKFVAFLNAKKRYLEPAMESCEQISTRVWSEFMEDALAQISLSQGKKLEDMRQSCTNLTTKCISGTASSMADFDARSLSVFGIAADRTVNEMCKSIRNSCTALMQRAEGAEEWNTGIMEISTDRTYEAILSTCSQIGKNCIIQQCGNTSGNFKVCEILNSVGRRNILNREVCFDDIKKCVADAGQDAIARIMARIPTQPTGSSWTGAFYDINFANLNLQADPNYADLAKNYHYPFDICNNCTNASVNFDCQVCRIAEKIWGNCEREPGFSLNCPDGYLWNANTGVCDGKPEILGEERYRINRVLPGVDETILSWFVRNTSTESSLDNCYGAQCPIGFVWNPDLGSCVIARDVTNDGQNCSAANRMTISEGWTNCCTSGVRDVFGNCCVSISAAEQKYVPISPAEFMATNGKTASFTLARNLGLMINKPSMSPASKLCLKRNVQFIGTQDSGHGIRHLFCVGNGMTYKVTEGVEKGRPYNANGSDAMPHCDGEFLFIDPATGIYSSPSGNSRFMVSISYNGSSVDVSCSYGNGGYYGWGDDPECDKINWTPSASGNDFYIKSLGL